MYHFGGVWRQEVCCGLNVSQNSYVEIIIHMVKCLEVGPLEGLYVKRLGQWGSACEIKFLIKDPRLAS